MRYLPTTLVMVSLSTLLAIAFWSPTSGEAQADRAATTQDNNERLEIRFAQAHVDLAKIDLRRALEANKRVPNLYTAEYIEKLKLHIVIDEAELAQRREGADDPHQVCIRGAEASLKIAEADMKAARTFQQRMPSSINALAAERAEVVARIAKLNLARAKTLKDSESALTHLQWQIDQLRHQVLELQMQR